MRTSAENESGRSAGLAGFARIWSNISPSLVPVLAVITAFLAGIPLITLTVSDSMLQPDIAKGLQVSATAYAALVESITGLTINKAATADDFDELRLYAADNDITTGRSLSRQARPFERVVEVGVEETRLFTEFFERYELDEETAAAIAERVPQIIEIGEETLRGLQPLLAELEALKRSNVRDLGNLVAGETELSADKLEQAAGLVLRQGSSTLAQRGSFMPARLR